MHATDDYEAVVAWGEFDPGDEDKAVLLAYEEGGQPLTQDGMARPPCRATGTAGGT